MPLLASVIVNNYNYGRFVGEAIESALAQTYPHTEVIVVDDGSTDESREVISRYDGRVRTILKENGGQISALNAGFAEARGDVIYFLDSDDLLDADALERTVALFDPAEPTAKVHWPLRFIDSDGRPTGHILPSENLGAGDLRETLIAHGPDSYVSGSSSANAWARGFLDEHFPLAAPGRHGEKGLFVDAHLSMLAPFSGRIERIAEPLGCYRLHGANWYAQGLGDDETLEAFIRGYEARCRALAGYCRERGIEVDPASWEGGSWGHQFRLARREVTRAVPAGTAFGLVDDQTLYDEIGAGRRLVRLFDRGGDYHGPPVDDDAAIAELSRVCAAGAERLVVAWPSFWWFDSYPGFAARLDEIGHRSFQSERLIVYEIAPACA